MLDRQDEHVHQLELLSVAVEIIEGLGHWPLNDVFNGHQTTFDVVPRHGLEHRINGGIGQVACVWHRHPGGFFRIGAWWSQKSQLHEPSSCGARSSSSPLLPPLTPVAIGCIALLLYHDLAAVQTPKQALSAEKF